MIAVDIVGFKTRVFYYFSLLPIFVEIHDRIIRVAADC